MLPPEARAAKPQPDQQMHPVLSVELGDVGKYRYMPQVVVREALAGFDYEEDMMAVNAMYISPDGQIGVAVVRYREEDYKGHYVGNPVVKGVDGEESMGQALLLFMYFTGRIPEGQMPLLRESTVKRIYPVVPTTDVNIVVTPPTMKDERNFTGNAQMIIGKTVVAEAAFWGYHDDRRALRIGRKRREAIQGRTPLLFPLGE